MTISGLASTRSSTSSTSLFSSVKGENISIHPEPWIISTTKEKEVTSLQPLKIAKYQSSTLGFNFVFTGKPFASFTIKLVH